MIKEVGEDEDEDGVEGGGFSPFPPFPFGGFSPFTPSPFGGFELSPYNLEFLSS